MKKEKEWLNIILVGSNPMPCYVQAAHLMDKAGWTEEEKENLFVPTPAFADPHAGNSDL